MEPENLIEAVRYFADVTICNRYMRQIKWPDVVRMVGYDPLTGDEVEPDDLCKNYSSKEAATEARKREG